MKHTVYASAIRYTCAYKFTARVKSRAQCRIGTSQKAWRSARRFPLAATVKSVRARSSMLVKVAVASPRSSTLVDPSL